MRERESEREKERAKETDKRVKQRKMVQNIEFYIYITQGKFFIKRTKIERKGR